MWTIFVFFCEISLILWNFCAIFRTFAPPNKQRFVCRANRERDQEIESSWKPIVRKPKKFVGGRNQQTYICDEVIGAILRMSNHLVPCVGNFSKKSQTSYVHSRLHNIFIAVTCSQGVIVMPKDGNHFLFIDEVSFRVVRNCDSGVGLGGQKLMGSWPVRNWKLFYKPEPWSLSLWVPLASHDPHQSRFSVRNAQKCLFTAALMKWWINKNEQLSCETITSRGFTSGQQRIFGNVCGRTKLRLHTRMRMARRKKVSSFCHIQIFWDASTWSRQTRVFAEMCCLIVNYIISALTR